LANADTLNKEASNKVAKLINDLFMVGVLMLQADADVEAAPPWAAD